jgi:hypothetical protein
MAELLYSQVNPPLFLFVLIAAIWYKELYIAQYRNEDAKGGATQDA